MMKKFMENTMQKIILCLIALTTLASCFNESPRDKRKNSGTDKKTEQQDFYDWFSNNNPNTGGNAGDLVPVADENETNEATETNSVTQNISIPEDIKHCSWSQDGSSGFTSKDDHLGSAYTFCKSKNGQKAAQLDIYFQMADAIKNSQLCFIPTTNKGKKTVYVGNARCLNILSNRQIYKITLIADRYPDVRITGVMIMKDEYHTYPRPYYQSIPNPDAYYFCSRWYEETDDPRYCDTFRAEAQYFSVDVN